MALGRPKVLRYCDNEAQLMRELEIARKVSSAVSLLCEALPLTRHHTVSDDLGRALAQARSAHAHLENHCEYYFGPEAEVERPERAE